MAEFSKAPRFVMLKRLSMAAATAFLSIAVFTGAPLLALWAGSRVSGQTVLSMKAVFVVLVVLAILVFLLALALTWLNNTYDELVGRPRADRRASWLRSVRGDSQGDIGGRVGETSLERIVVISVYAAVILALIWFFFFAHASLT
jgi:hypothetical protein